MEANYVHKDSTTLIHGELVKNELNQIELQYNALKQQKFNELLKENQELKQKYENAVADYETTMAEKNKLKKQLEEYKEQVNKGLYNTCLPYTTGYNKAIKDKETQQKEFIKFLEDNYKETQDIWYIKILQKYKSIIGDINDKK